MSRQDCPRYMRFGSAKGGAKPERRLLWTIRVLEPRSCRLIHSVLLTALRHRVALPGLLAGCVALGSCTSLRRVQPAEFFAKNSPDVVWVTHTNRTVVPVAQPEIVRDTLRGMWQGTSRPVAIPLGDIQHVQARVPDKTKTVALVVGGMAGFVASVYFIWIVQAGPEPGSVHCGVDIRVDPIQYC